MSNSLLFASVVFAVVMFFTPGPNNIMLLSSGLTYGFRRTVPHIAGITVGFAFMVGAVGVGLGGNVLIGGSANSIALQPLSVQGQVGLAVSAGLESLELRPGR